MLIAYLDEFGHVGPYIGTDHPKYNTHPVFGYAGFVMPSQNVRVFGGFFEHIKETLLDFEIKRDGAHPRRWEKKGAALLTTQNVEKYPELTNAVHRLLKRLRDLDGRVIYYGQVKPTGSEKETGESSSDRNAHHLRQILTRLSTYAHNCNSDVMVVLDATDEKPRLDAVAAMSSFIYATSSPPEMKRIVEVPMQVESHLYGTIQFADWMCALLGRMSHCQFVEESQFSWAPERFGRELLGVCAADHSKIHVPGTGRDSYPKYLCTTHKTRQTDALITKRAVRTPRAISNNIGDVCPALGKFKDSLS